MNEDEIYLALADLFFLDDEPDEDEFMRVARLLSDAGWSKEKTEDILLSRIAPVAGMNLGYMIYPPVAPHWGTFAGTEILQKIKDHRPDNSLGGRLKKRWYRRMLRQLGGDRLLSKL